MGIDIAFILREGNYTSGLRSKLQDGLKAYRNLLGKDNIKGGGVFYDFEQVIARPKTDDRTISELA